MYMTAIHIVLGTMKGRRMKKAGSIGPRTRIKKLLFCVEGYRKRRVGISIHRDLKKSRVRTGRINRKAFRMSLSRTGNNLEKLPAARIESQGLVVAVAISGHNKR